MKTRRNLTRPNRLFAFTLGALVPLVGATPAQAATNLAQAPLFVSGAAAPPLNMLVMGRDHTLYYEAYNDASDLNDDGVLDVGYKPITIDYYGYFDSHLCYTYSSSDRRFNPTATTTNKKCSGAWSGDFLNYITTTRIDALRKVLYGGHRVIDTADLTVLERSYIPQDAHSWGKEYQGIDHDGYDIREYTPLTLPAANSRHLFANTTLLKTANKEPLMRVLTNSKHRIWEWVAIERPVAGDECVQGSTRSDCVTSGGTDWEIVPASVLELTQTLHKVTTTNASTGGDYPSDEGQFDSLVALNATTANLCGTATVANIDGSGNPFSGTNGCSDESYLNVFSGQIDIAEGGTYTFSVDGDDAVELEIDNTIVASWYGGHGNCNCNSHSGSIYLTAGSHDLRFRHQEASGGDNYYLRWQRTSSASARSDFVVRVSVCDPDYPESHCKTYPEGSSKPTGLLQKYGEADRMHFGLISGSFTHPYNMQGGVLRKNIESFTDELDLETGIFEDVPGIVSTIDRFRVVDFNKDTNYEYQGGWLTTAPMSGSDRQFPDWGNPIGEMMFESLRYFSGKESATSDFTPPLTNDTEEITLRDHTGESTMALPAPDWEDPYTREDNPAPYCSPGAQLVISDVNPSYDTDSIPGTSFGTGFSSDIDGLNATTEANAIWNSEHGGSSLVFIGQSGNVYDGAPSAKSVAGLGDIRGLSPSEPTKQGGYYSAGIARYAFLNDLRSDLAKEQNINTFAVALASPLPRIEIPVGDSRVALVPFAKSVGGSGIDAAMGQFQPTNSIVDFFVEKFANTATDGSDSDPTENDGRPYVKFRINFEDVEQGADHDMDAIAVYEAKVNSDGTLTVELNSEYAAGGIMQHMGYVISGTTADGVYLEIRDKDTDAGSDPAYFLNTPTGRAPGYCAFSSPPNDCAPLPLFASRTFVASAGADVAKVLENPLWYAAKYGSKGNEDLGSGEPSPNYFLVTNAGQLQDQLEKAFQRILQLGEQSGTSAAASTAVLQSDTLLYTAGFRSEDWTGTLIARKINTDGTLSLPDCIECWDTEKRLATTDPSARNIVTVKYEVDEDVNLTRTAVDFDIDNLGAEQKAALNRPVVGSEPDNLGEARVAWLRGDEEANESFRRRLSDSGDLRLLGDIVNSNPQFIGRTYHGSGRLLGAPSDRVRPDVIYIGANDGMLHAVNAESGAELFAFVPGSLLMPETGQSFSLLNRLMSPSYTRSVSEHRYSVDGTPAVEEAFIGDAWKTVLVGTQGAGGRSVFALDVTNPQSFTTANVLWEFTDPDLGYNVGQPAIARLKTGDNTYEWVAMFGNGYNGVSQSAMLFIVRLSDGQLIQKIDTGVGDGSNPNGLASPKWTHWPANDLNANRIYAGDLFGNLWRFDVSNPASRSVSLMFTAKDANDEEGVAQPITVRPTVATAPDDRNSLIVAFGTGSYFRVPDAADRQTQTLYAIRDTVAATDFPVLRTQLLRQEITAQDSVNIGDITYKLRRVSANSFEPEEDAVPYRGWYLDLKWEDEVGERVISEASFSSGPARNRIRFTTLIPDEDPCSGGRRGFLYDLDLLSGGRFGSPVFDLDKNDTFDSNDTVNGEPPSGIAFGSGERLTVIQVPGKNVEYGYDGSGSEVVRLEGGGGLSGRQSWQQLR